MDEKFIQNFKISFWNTENTDFDRFSQVLKLKNFLSALILKRKLF